MIGTELLLTFLGFNLETALFAATSPIFLGVSKSSLCTFD